MHRNITKLPLVLLLITVLLSACGKPAAPAAIEQPLLEFPGTAWNMTPEEVSSALSIQDAERIGNARELGENQIVFGVTGREFLGEEAITMFEFYAAYGTRQGLRYVYVIYPAATDTAALTQQLTKMLGEPTAPGVKENRIWCSSTPIAEFLPVDSTFTFPTDTPAVHITLYPHFSDLSPQYAIPSVDFDEDGPVIVFCANHLSFLQTDPVQ